MQNRYTGDIGDFGKLGLLGCLRDLSIGVNWYLTPDETHNGDGRHVGYLEDKRYRACDELLWYRLSELVREGKRDTSELESLLPAVFYRNELNTQKMKKAEREIARMAWHADALKKLRGCDLVFLDPDNGLMVPSAGAKSNKYVKPEEIVDYYAQGSSVIYYQHKARRKDEFYIHQLQELTAAIPNSTALGLKFKTTSQRYYFFVIRPEHREKIEKAVGQMMKSAWKTHFILLLGTGFHTEV